MKTLNIAGIGIAGIAVVIGVAAHGQNTAASNNEPEAETVVDAHGNLHVPGAYRTTYQALGSWAVAADHRKGSKEQHVVYASPGTIAAYRESGHFPDGAVLVKEVFDAATENGDRHCQPSRKAQGLVRHDEGHEGPLPRQQVMGRRLGLVVV